MMDQEENRRQPALEDGDIMGKELDLSSRNCRGQVLKSDFCQNAPRKMALQQKQYYLYYC